MSKIPFALFAALALSAPAGAAEEFDGLKAGSVVTYTLSSDESVRKVGTIVEVQHQSSATWYSIETWDMSCGKDRDVVRSDYIVALGGSSPCRGDPPTGAVAQPQPRGADAKAPNADGLLGAARAKLGRRP